MGKIYPFKLFHTKEVASAQDVKDIADDSKKPDEISTETDSDSDDDIIDRIREEFKPFIGKRRVLKSIPTQEEEKKMDSDNCVRFIDAMQTEVRGNRLRYQSTIKRTKKQKDIKNTTSEINQPRQLKLWEE
jgi:hypothetical protein